MLMNINEPPLSVWNPTKYVGSWLLKHRSADDNHPRKAEPLQEPTDKKISVEYFINYIIIIL